MRLPVTLLLLPTALTAALHSVADTPLHALLAPPRPCPPGYTCFPTASAFARAVNVAGPPGPTSSKLALLCPPASPCTLRGTQLGTAWGLEATLLMENVVLENAPAAHAGSLLNIDSGRVTGVNVSFLGGSSATGAGCVSNYHYFKCTDCVFSDCHAAQYGGALSSGGHAAGHGLVLVRPVFIGNNTCGGKLTPGDVKPCGAACWCLGTDASKCVGCTCAVHPKYGNFYCGGGGGGGDVGFSRHAPAAALGRLDPTRNTSASAPTTTESIGAPPPPLPANVSVVAGGFSWIENICFDGNANGSMYASHYWASFLFF